MRNEASLVLAGQTLRLLPERCVFWEETGTLILADLHLGKAAHLRHHGMPVPEGHTADDLDRLTSVIQRTAACGVIICGDFFHAATAQSPAMLELVEAWRRRHPGVAVSLVTGNHDRGRALPPERCGIASAGTRWLRPPFHFIHDPAEAVAGGITVSGHLHPLAALAGPQPIKAPCFWWREARRTLVLPAFGSCTAGVSIQPETGDTLHAIFDRRILAVPPGLCRPGRSRRLTPRPGG